jgi:hypothetical protein
MDMVASQDGGGGHADDFAVCPDPDARCDTPAGDLAGGLNALSDNSLGSVALVRRGSESRVVGRDLWLVRITMLLASRPPEKLNLCPYNKYLNAIHI